jgi:heme/copper-type cytochrome/quinol oxidase subunit 4
MGAQVGAVATKYIKGYGIRIAFGTAVIGCILSIVLKLIPDYIAGTKAATDIMAVWLVNGLVVALSAYITVRMVQGARREIAAKKARG